VRLKTFTAITHMLDDGSWHELDDLREAASFPVEWVQEPRHVAEYVADRSADGLGASVVGRDVDLLHAIFKTAVKEELVEANPPPGPNGRSCLAAVGASSSRSRSPESPRRSPTNRPARCS
jgi:hypothetical protein